ncbi:MAG: hypothetical protein K1X53_15740 [Candidatus Sumerlaeaceae bacterium]|nr:hypothetical protein [Candidatus Sumerlaeaceae bacterium]
MRKGAMLFMTTLIALTGLCLPGCSSSNSGVKGQIRQYDYRTLNQEQRRQNIPPSVTGDIPQSGT